MPGAGQSGGASRPGSSPVRSPASSARSITWIALAVLFLQQAIDIAVRSAPWVVWLAVLVPLVIFLPGMLRDNLRSYIWLCFVSLLYFMRLVVALFAQPDNLLRISGMVAVVILFTSSMLYVRWRERELRATPDQLRQDDLS